MCTALITRSANGEHFFGRNMDLPEYYNFNPLFIPKSSSYINKATGEFEVAASSILGMGSVIDGYPALAEGMNSSGLACAGLNFDMYRENESLPAEGKINMPPYHFTLWVLANFMSVDDVEKHLSSVNFKDVPINANNPVPTLHWMIADKSGKSIVVEKTAGGLSVFENPIGVMTNDPEFSWHLTHLNQYIKLCPIHPKPTIWGDKKLAPLGVGSGSIGLPGDFASASRFVRIAYLKANMPRTENTSQAVGQFFHMLDNTAMVKGAVMTKSGADDFTLYSCCMDLANGVYYYKTYGNNRINAITMHGIEASEIKIYPYFDAQDINFLN